MKITLFILGVVLIIGGALILAKPGGIPIKTSKKVFDLDAGRMMIEKENLVTVSPSAGIVFFIGGTILVILALRHKIHPSSLSK